MKEFSLDEVVKWARIYGAEFHVAETTEHRRRLGIVFGAGASKGAGRLEPFAPPLGNELFDCLRRDFPETWGQLRGSLRDKFIDNFEIGMYDLWNSGSNDTSQLLIDTAIFFSQFRAPADGSDCYSKLVRTLKNLDLIPRTGVVSLNYECTLEIAANNCGLGLTILGERPAPANLIVWKPHGSCNFLPHVGVWNLTIVLPGGLSGYYDGPFEVLAPTEVRRRYERGYALPPAMSLFAPGKHTPVATEFVSQIRQQWAQWVASVDVVVIIGVRPIAEDGHIWDPVIHSGCEVWHIGDTNDPAFRQFSTRARGRVESLGNRFEPSLNELISRLRLFAEE
jgi:hypothetical protein